MSKIFERDRLVQYMEMVRPLEGSIQVKICESHEVLRNQVHELGGLLKEIQTFLILNEPNDERRAYLITQIREKLFDLHDPPVRLPSGLPTFRP
jgi:hypothetical protein